MSVLFLSHYFFFFPFRLSPTYTLLPYTTLFRSRTDSSRGKDRLGDRCAKVPSTGGTAEQVGKRRRLEASASAEGNLREIGGPRDPDAGVRGNQLLLRFANIGPAFQQGGS